MKPWINKYTAQNSSEILGQEKALHELKDFVATYRNKKQKCCIIHGPVGSGKTSAVIAVAHEQQYEIVEMNASDFRKRDIIEHMIGTAINQQSLFHKGKVILIDEIDGLSGTKDRGALAGLTKLIAKSTFPIICTVEDPYNPKLKDLRKKSLLIEFIHLTNKAVIEKLTTILHDNSCEFEETAIKAIAYRSGGDMRAAINDIQTLTESGSKKLTKENVDKLASHERNKTEKLTNALMKVLKTTSADIAKNAFENVDDDIDTIALWLEENIPKEYEIKDLAKAFHHLSRADVFKGRIRRWQYWRFLTYMMTHYSAGVATSKDERQKKVISYSPPGRLLQIWRANMKYQKRKVIAEKVAIHTHTSTRTVLESTLPYIQKMSKNKTMSNQFQEYFDLSDEEIAWLQSSN
ncbi:MAG: replication factor C large subunit [Candidatus Woesearchaeota archaeon]